VSSNPAHGEMYSIQHYVIKVVNDLRQVCGFLRVLRHDIIEILFKVALNTITLFHSDNVQQTVEHLIYYYNTSEQSNIHIPQNNDRYSALLLSF